jgi:segregation and condensation protein A
MGKDASNRGREYKLKEEFLIMMEFKIEKFSGPLGLLLSMIEREEMDITEINLARIADDYVLYIKKAKDISSEELSDFLVVAAKLLYIKSKALLPYLVIDEEEDDSADLERQLKMYKEFVDASLQIKAIILQENFLFLPPINKSRCRKDFVIGFYPPVKITADLLASKLKDIITDLDKQKKQSLREERLAPKINIEEKIELIKDLLIKKARVNFSHLLASAGDRMEIIVSFLAVLELAKQKELVFEQKGLFSEIHILNQINKNEKL